MKDNLLIARFMGFEMVVTDFNGINIIKSPEGETFGLGASYQYIQWYTYPILNIWVG